VNSEPALYRAGWNAVFWPPALGEANRKIVSAAPIATDWSATV
jgi:hypothetical protein